MDFNTMIGDCNISWVEEFYTNALGYAADDYNSTVRGKTINYAPDRIDAVFGFRGADYCWAS
ncbi:hypothetical protein A2U01_0086987 [Trifolium medium]|uniref:Uncharacterized protein n=1 Tax=Trifolium medium TaxID=97028 RepID=A0A392TXN5_9FABA|nr:hypothetical protein [Trifolium medium]